jgi:arylsulfatase A-like enzyme
MRNTGKNFTIKSLLIILLIMGVFKSLAQKKKATKPNFIVIFTDDQGYGDLGCFGSPNLKTPNIDKMALKGMKLASFYVAAPLCTPSRVALMTGSYPKRVNMVTGSKFLVLLAADSKGLNPNEITIAEILKKQGYTTGIFGKWHLKDHPEFLPTRQGFDEFFGVPYSHDIHPYHPKHEHFNFPTLPLMDGKKVIELNPDANRLTSLITQRATHFIEQNKDRPFFVYIPQILSHHPIQVSKKFMKGVNDSIKKVLSLENDNIDYTTRGSLYPQAIAEIDWSVGQILDKLKKLKLLKNTFVIFTSDNGPDGAYNSIPLGSAGPLRGRKGSTFEGGMRVPTVMYWPGVFPAGETNDELMTTMDLLPTFAKLAGAEVPEDRKLDGKDIMPNLLGKDKSPYEYFFYYSQNDLMAVR